MKRIFVIFLFFAVCCLPSLFTGCGQRKPPGFPPVYPCTITVTKDGTALPNISVMLIPENPIDNVSITGGTDQNGTATIRTVSSYYSASGAPEGKYVIVLLDNVSVDLPEIGDDVYESWSPQRRQAWDDDIEKRIREARIIHGSLRNPLQSQASVTVTSSGSEATIDITEHR